MNVAQAVCLVVAEMSQSTVKNAGSGGDGCEMCGERGAQGGEDEAQ
jgi:hypothetical protein